GMPREAEDGTALTVAGPEVVDDAVAQALDLKIGRCQALRHDLLTTLVGRGHRGTRQEIAGELEGAGHRWARFIRATACHGKQREPGRSQARGVLSRHVMRAS